MGGGLCKSSGHVHPQKIITENEDAVIVEVTSSGLVSDKSKKTRKGSIILMKDMPLRPSEYNKKLLMTKADSKVSKLYRPSFSFAFSKICNMHRERVLIF